MGEVKGFAAVCFDMDGVLIDSRQAIEQAWTHVARRYDISIDNETLEEHVHGRPGNHTLNTLFGGFSEKERQKIKREVDTLEETAPSPLIPGVADMLRALRRKRVPCALVTSSWPERVHFVLGLHGLQGDFGVIVHREDVVRGKPDPQCYQIAAQRLGVASEDCLIFEDSHSGMLAAVHSGALCIAIGSAPKLGELGASAQYTDFRAFYVQSSSFTQKGHSVFLESTWAMLC